MVYHSKGVDSMAKKSILNDTPINLIKKYKKILTENNIPVEKIILFGSYAKGKQKSWSDVDICVVSKIFGRNGFNEMVRLKKLTGEADSMLEPHPYHPKNLEDPFDPLAHEIRKYGKVVI